MTNPIVCSRPNAAKLFFLMVWSGLTSSSLCPHAWCKHVSSKLAKVNGPWHNSKTRVFCVRRLMRSYGDETQHCPQQSCVQKLILSVMTQPIPNCLNQTDFFPFFKTKWLISNEFVIFRAYINKQKSSTEIQIDLNSFNCCPERWVYVMRNCKCPLLQFIGAKLL